MIALRRSVWVCAAIILVLFLGQSAPAAVPVVEWTQQFGTAGNDNGNGVAADVLGNVFVAGEGIVAGGGAGFLRLYDAAGAVQWTRDLPSGYGEAEDVSADGLGNSYITGAVNILGNSEVYLRKYDLAGGLLWSEVFGSTEADLPSSVSTDGAGNVYVSGSTLGELGGPNPTPSIDAFVTKYDSDGNHQWSRQLGSYIFHPVNVQIDISFSVAAVDALGNVFIAGRTDGDLDGTSNGSLDGFIAKYDTDGVFQWARQYGTTFSDISRDVTIDDLGNAYVAGVDGGSTLSGGTANQATLRKFDTDGNLLWMQTLDTSQSESLDSVSFDGLGAVYVAGATEGSLEGANAGMADVFVSKFDLSGSLLWTKQFGSTATDADAGIAADGLGSIYATGFTSGSLFGPNAGQGDAFLLKLTEEVPEPVSRLLLVSGIPLLMSLVRRRCRTRTRR